MRVDGWGMGEGKGQERREKQREGDRDLDRLTLRCAAAAAAQQRAEGGSRLQGAASRLPCRGQANRSTRGEGGQVGGHSASSSQTAARTARHLPTTPTVRDGKQRLFPGGGKLGCHPCSATAPSCCSALLLAACQAERCPTQSGPHNRWALAVLPISAPHSASTSPSPVRPDHLISSQRTPVHLRACFRPTSPPDLPGRPPVSISKLFMRSICPGG